MLRVFLLLLLMSLTVSMNALEPEINGRIAKIERDSGSRIGVVATDSASGQRIAYRSNERFLMCSTFKLLAVAAILRQVDRKQENLDRFVRYNSADILEYAPVTKKHVAEGGMRLGALCEAAIEQSDNTAGISYSRRLAVRQASPLPRVRWMTRDRAWTAWNQIKTIRKKVTNATVQRPPQCARM